MPTIIDSAEPEGNAFAIIGLVRRFLTETGQADQIESALSEMQSGDYENLCEVAERVTLGAIVVR